MMKRISLLILAAMIWSCDSEPRSEMVEGNGQEMGVNEKPFVISAQLSPYAMSNGSKVNSIRVKLANTSDPVQVSYLVELVQGDRSWKDTLSIFMGKNDTIGGDMIFPESVVDSLEPASFSGELMVLDKEPS